LTDGALGSWGSALIDPYTDRPWTSGSLLINASTLSNLTLAWALEGFQVNIHAIGDLANRLAIDSMSSALDILCPNLSQHDCQTLHRFRIEHAQIIHQDDQKRIHEMGIIPSIQPTHATSDMGYAEVRLGKKRTSEEAYRMRSLLPVNPVLGSDFPVEPPDPFQGIFAAITRRSPQTGLDADGGHHGWYMHEALTLEEALRGFTAGPAHGAFLDGKAGMIEVGAYADWVVLDKPLEDMEVDDLRALHVKETWVAGRMIYGQ
jgi:predicted amidohydrolase YtcJ